MAKSFQPTHQGTYEVSIIQGKYTTEPKRITVKITVSADLKTIAEELAYKAYHSKKKRSMLGHGAIRVTA